MKHLILPILFIVQFQVIAQKLSHDQALEDLNFLVENIHKYPPAFPHYHPEFESLATQLIESMPGDSLTIFEHFTNISSICALANEGHFALGDWEDAVHKGIPDNNYAYLPVSIKIVSGRLYVWKDYSNEKQLNHGDEIRSINGLETASILSKLLSATPSDGNILTYAYRKIEDGFPWLYYFQFQQSDTLEIASIDQNGEHKTVTIKALVRSDQVVNYRKYYPDTDPANESESAGFYKLSYTDDYALLSLPSFDFRRVNKFDVKSKNMYKGIFSELQEREVMDLIIDLRDNTGGRNEFADDMVPFIMKNPHADPYLKKTISWDRKERIYHLPKVSKLAFEGDIYVLVNAKTYSAGSSLARFLKEYGNAIMIGTETGTRYEGFAGGSEQVITLPNAQIEIGIPRYHIAYPASKKQITTNRGLIPDYEISYSFDDLVNGKDLHMEKAISLIRGGSK